MKTIVLDPIGDRIAVEVDKAEDTTPGGIVLPEMAKDKPQRGVVIAVGPGASGKDAAPMVLKVGDRVLFGRYAGAEVEVDGEQVVIMRECDVLARLGE